MLVPPAPRHAQSAARPACAVLAGYLTLTLLPLAAAAAAPGPARVALPAHAVLLALAVWGARRPSTDGSAPPAPTVVGDALAAWLPLLAIPLLYAGLPTIAAALAGIPGAAAPAPMHDARVLGWERLVFGPVSPAVALARRWPSPALSELLHAGYLSYYLVIYLPPLLLWRAHRRAAFTTSVLTVLLAFVVCYAVFLPFPVQGPWYTWPHPAAVPRGPLRALVERLLAAGSSRGTAFPSSHVAVSVAQTVALARVAPRLAIPAAVATVLLAGGAVYGGLHYGIDVVAGAVVGLVVGGGVWGRGRGDGVTAGGAGEGVAAPVGRDRVAAGFAGESVAGAVGADGARVRRRGVTMHRDDAP